MFKLHFLVPLLQVNLQLVQLVAKTMSLAVSHSSLGSTDPFPQTLITLPDVVLELDELLLIKDKESDLNIFFVAKKV